MHTNQQIESTLKRIIAKHTDSDESDVLYNTDFIGDLGGDSLDIVGIICDTEVEFKITISDTEAERVKTLNELEMIVKKKLKAAEL